MPSNEINRVWTQAEPVPLDVLRGMMYTEENGAHTIHISGRTSQGAALALSGTVLCKFTRSDDVTVDVSGSTSGGVASVTLHRDCYNVPGRFSLVVEFSDGGPAIVIYAAIGDVQRSSSGREIDSGAPVPSLIELETAYDNVVAATAAAVAAAAKAVRYDTAQSLTAGEKQQARENIDAGLGLVAYGHAQSLNATQKALARQNIDAGAGMVPYAESITLNDAQKMQARLNIAAAYISSLAVAFAADQYYAAGSIVSHEGYIWYFTANHPAGAWTGNDVDLVNVAYLLSRYWVRADAAQSLNAAQKAQAQANMGVSDAIAGMAVRYDAAQSLTDAQKAQALANAGGARVYATDFGGNASGMMIKY